MLSRYGETQVVDGARGARVADRRRRRRHRRGDARPRRLRRRRRRRPRAPGAGALRRGRRRAWAPAAARSGPTARCCRGRCRARSGTRGRRRCPPRSPRARRLDRRDLLRPAIADAASFTPHLLVAGGPDNGWQPSPTDRTQIAYGADCGCSALLAVADAARPARPAAARRRRGHLVLRQQPRRRARCTTPRPVAPSTACPRDGVVNRNSGAESTIHGLLVDARARRGARTSPRWSQVAAARSSATTWRVAEAEDGDLCGRRVDRDARADLDRRERVERRRT